MKIAVFTDVHGNLPALKAVLEDIDQKEVSHIYCLGDMIAIGPNTNDVLDLLFSRKDMTMLTGNHDEAILALIKGEPYPESHQSSLKHHEWIAKRLDSKFIPLLENLPRRISMTIDNVDIYFTHYRIRPDKMDAHISEDPFHSIIEPSLANMEQLFKYFKEKLICFGHHHPRHFFSNGKKTYLNPGALGCQPTPHAPYALIDIKNGEYSIEIKDIPYHNGDFLKSYKTLQVPDREFILKVFHGGQL